jgi:outer membrane protein OmpU
MKNTLLTTTALVAMTGAAAAELTISGSGRLGLMTTEGSAAKTTAAAAGNWVGAEVTSAGQLATVYTTAPTALTAEQSDGATITAADRPLVRTTEAFSTMAHATTNAPTDADAAALSRIIAEIENKIATNTQATAVQAAAMASDLAAANYLLGKAMGTAASTTAAVADSTSALNRFRISFKGSGETDSGMAYGISGRAEQSDGVTVGSQYISGAFGKISMGDLDGADEVGAGGGVSGVGLGGLGDHNDISYQSSNHNIGYQYSASGFTFAYSTDTAVKTGGNSAMGLSFSGDMGGAALSIGVGTSDVGVAKQSTMSVSASTGGLTLKAYTSTNDNGPEVAAVTQVARGTAALGATTAWVQGSTKKTNGDTDQTAVSVSYSMDALTVTGFAKTVTTAGVDTDYSGFGLAYDMGGMTMKAGIVDADNIQSVDFGVSFSF